MKAGALRKQVAIEQATETRDTHGQPIKTWTTFAIRWAAIEPLEGRELFSARQIHAEATHLIGLRYVAGITPKMRITLGGRAFDILAIRNMKERNRELEITAVERL